MACGGFLGVMTDGIADPTMESQSVEIQMSRNLFK